MDDLFLIVRIAGHRLAIAAQDVGSVVEIDHITPVPGVAPHVAGLFALRSRVLTVIDSHVALGAPPVARGVAMSAVIVASDGHSYALLVDDVEDVVSGARPAPCVAVLGPMWERILIGQIEGLELDASTILLVDPAAIVAMPEARAA